MVRILAFALNAHEHLEMTKGLSTDDEPDIWQKSLSDEINVWVALGLPSEKVMRQSSRKAAKAIVYSYGARVAEMWWDKVNNGTTRFDNLQVVNFSETDTPALAKLPNRAMKVQVNIQDGEVMVSVDFPDQRRPGDSQATPAQCPHRASRTAVPINVAEGSLGPEAVLISAALQIAAVCQAS
jgi:uncharacterized protein YaeQ